MGAPKLKTSELSRLYQQDKNQNLRDKQTIEALRERLNQALQRDPAMVKKAALILERWLQQKK